MYMDDAEILASYRKAENQSRQIGVLADLNGTSRNAMARHLIELGEQVPVKPKPTSRPTFDVSRARELHAAGQTDLEIAEQLGVHKTSFATWRRGQGLKCNPAPKTPKPKNAKAAPGPAPAVPAPEASGTMTALRVSEIFGQIAQWHPTAKVRIRGVYVSGITLESKYGSDGDPVLEISVD